LNGAAVVADVAATMPDVTTMLIAHSLGPTLELGAGDVGIQFTQGVLSDAHLITYSGA
jgi:hypothetical protein